MLLWFDRPKWRWVWNIACALLILIGMLAFSAAPNPGQWSPMTVIVFVLVLAALWSFYRWHSMAIREAREEKVRCASQAVAQRREAATELLRAHLADEGVVLVSASDVDHGPTSKMYRELTDAVVEQLNRRGIHAVALRNDNMARAIKNDPLCQPASGATPVTAFKSYAGNMGAKYLLFLIDEGQWMLYGFQQKGNVLNGVCTCLNISDASRIVDYVLDNLRVTSHITVPPRWRGEPMPWETVDGKSAPAAPAADPPDPPAGQVPDKTPDQVLCYLAHVLGPDTSYSSGYWETPEQALKEAFGDLLNMAVCYTSRLSPVPTDTQAEIHFDFNLLIRKDNLKGGQFLVQ